MIINAFALFLPLRKQFWFLFTNMDWCLFSIVFLEIWPVPEQITLAWFSECRFSFLFYVGLSGLIHLNKSTLLFRHIRLLCFLWNWVVFALGVVTEYLRTFTYLVPIRCLIKFQCSLLKRVLLYCCSFFYCFTKTKQKKGRCSLYMLFYIAESGFLPNFLEANPVWLDVLKYIISFALSDLFLALQCFLSF